MTYLIVSVIGGFILFISTAFMYDVLIKIFTFLKIKIKDETIDKIEIIINPNIHAE